MKTEIFYAPSYSLAVVPLEPGEKIQAESGAMVSMTEGLDTHLTGPGRALLQTRSAHALAGWLAPLLPAGSDSASKRIKIGGFSLGD